MKTTRLEYSLGYKIFSKAEVIGIFVLKGEDSTTPIALQFRNKLTIFLSFQDQFVIF